MGAFHQRRGSLQVLWVCMKLSVAFPGVRCLPTCARKGCEQSPASTDSGARGFLSLPLQHCWGIFFLLLDFFSDFLKLATVVPEGRTSSACCSGGAQRKHPFSQPGLLIRSEQGDAGALPQSLRCYAPAGQIKLLLLKRRAKKCKDPSPPVPPPLVVKSSFPFRYLSALAPLRASLPPQYLLR